MFLKSKGSSIAAVIFLNLSSPIMASTWSFSCPETIEVKDEKILELNGWIATTHANRRSAPEKYPLLDGFYKTDSKAPRLASYDINTKKVDPIAFDNLDEVMYPEDFGLTNPIGYWMLKSMKNEQWVYFCSADSKSIFLYKFVPAGIKKCSYVEKNQNIVEWHNASLVCE